MDREERQRAVLAPTPGLATLSPDRESPRGIRHRLRRAVRAGSIHFAPPYARNILLAFDPAGFVWYGVTDRYRIRRRDLTSEAEVAFDGPARARSLTRAESDSVDRYLETLKREFRVSYNEAIKPKAYPIFDGLYLSATGEQIWVKRAEARAGTQFDVFQRSGRLVSHALADLLIRSRPAPLISRDRVWALVLGEFDEPYVVRFRGAR